MELPPQRFSRPSQSTALPPIQNFFRWSFKPTVLFTVRTWRCCSPLVHARQRYACLADSYARPSQSTALPPIQNFFRWSFKPTVLFTVRTWRCCSPLVHARQRYACLADSYARPSQSTALPPIQNCCWQSQNASDILSYRFGMPACQLQTALVFYIYFL